jgi:hypothetical protein
MSENLLREHFTRFLGSDVQVSVVDGKSGYEILLYRPDKLSEAFVIRAFETFETAHPQMASRIDRLVVLYEGRFGREQYKLRVPFTVPVSHPHTSPIPDAGSLSP